MKIQSFFSIFVFFVVVHSFAQITCNETVSLPSSTKFGGGDVQGSPLIGTTYHAGQGPGIYIAADGGYKLYLNGDLLAYDQVAGRVRFVPITFLPGNNAISVVGINGSGAPGVLVHIEDLHQSYVSNATWKSKVVPIDNLWKNINYDASNWSNATLQSAGTINQTPGGQKILGFPTTSAASWIWSSNANDSSGVFRFSFSVKAIGFGANTTGGDGGTIVVVDNVADLLSQIASASAKTILLKEGEYDFRVLRDQKTCRVECNSTLQTYKGDFVDYAVSCPTNYRTIKRWEKLIRMTSNKSIIGMGRGASLRGASFYSNAGVPITNVIFRNLLIWDINPHIIEAADGISLNYARKLWVDHCTFKWISDGNDIGFTKECTFSWNRWNGYNEFMCTQRDNFTTMIQASDITFDHIWWEGADGRVPKIHGDSLSRVHMINNYHSDNLYYASYSGSPSNLLYIENTHYEGVRFPTVKENGGVVYCSGNKYDNIGSHSINWQNTSEPKDLVAKFSVPYAYKLENVNAVKSTCMTHAGAGGKWGALPLYTSTAVLSNTTPAVSITSPLNGALVSQTASLTIKASASDADGTIAKVEFYNGTIKIGEDTSFPYSYTVAPLSNCNFSIIARALDNTGKWTDSWPVIFRVSPITSFENNPFLPISISVYPNPAEDLVQLSKMVDWKVMNSLGLEVLAGTNSNRINMHSFVPGVYYIKTGNQTIRLLKQEFSR